MQSWTETKSPNDPDRKLGPIVDTTPTLRNVSGSISAHSYPFAKNADPVKKRENQPRLQSSETGGSLTIVTTLRSLDNKLFFRDGGVDYQNPIFYLTRVEYYRDTGATISLPDPVQVYARIENGDYVINTTSNSADVFGSELFNGYAHLFVLKQGAIADPEQVSYQNISTPIGTLQRNQKINVELLFKNAITGDVYPFADVMGTKGFIVLTLCAAYMK